MLCNLEGGVAPPPLYEQIIAYSLLANFYFLFFYDCKEGDWSRNELFFTS